MSAFKQRYRPALSAQVPQAVQGKVANAQGKLAVGRVDVMLLDSGTDQLITLRFDTGEIDNEEALMDRILSEVNGVEVAIHRDEQGGRLLTLTNDPTAEFPVVTIAVMDADQSIAPTVCVDSPGPGGLAGTGAEQKRAADD